jgi:drug/metabolite transporter (DMT)-like permease
MLFWAMSYVWVKVAYQYIGPFSLVFLRVFFTTIIMALVLKLSGSKLFVDRKHLKTFLALAFLEPFAYFIGESLGLQRVSSSIGSIMVATIPLFVPVFAYILLKEKLSKNTLIGLVISFIGIIILILKDDFSFDASPSGLGFMMIAVLSGAIFTIQIKKVAHLYPPQQVLFQMNFFGLLFFFPLFWWFEGPALLQTKVHFNLLLTVSELVIFSSILAMFFFIKAIDVIGVNRMSLFTNLIPVLTAVAAWMMLPNETFSAKLVIGIVIVLFGVFYGQFKANEPTL